MLEQHPSVATPNGLTPRREWPTHTLPGGAPTPRRTPDSGSRSTMRHGQVNADRTKSPRNAHSDTYGAINARWRQLSMTPLQRVA